MFYISIVDCNKSLKNNSIIMTQNVHTVQAHTNNVSSSNTLKEKVILPPGTHLIQTMFFSCEILNQTKLCFFEEKKRLSQIQ